MRKSQSRFLLGDKNPSTIMIRSLLQRASQSPWMKAIFKIVLQKRAKGRIGGART